MTPKVVASALAGLALAAAVGFVLTSEARCVLINTTPTPRKT